MGGGEPSGDGGTSCELCELDGPMGGGGDGSLVRRFFFDGPLDGRVRRRFFSDGLIDGRGPGRALAAGLVSNLLTSSSPKIASNGNC